MMTKRLMKDALAADAVARINASFTALDANWDGDHFESLALNNITELALKQRVSQFIAALAEVLPTKFDSAAKLLWQIPDVWRLGNTSDSWRAFAAWPVIDYVAAYGLHNPDIALPLLARLTHLFSAEFALRPFLIAHPKATLKTVSQWCESSSDHVRRLASEGTRTRLPWGCLLYCYIDDPAPILPILERLKSDSSLYVRRSVANSLNDISKDHPKRVLRICAEWLQQAQADGCHERQQNIRWVVNRGLRTLVKQGISEVYPLLGYTQTPNIRITEFMLDKSQYQLGESLVFTVAMTSAQQQSLVIDFVIDFVKANGELSSKVYKLKNIDIAEDECLTLCKKVSFKPITTRRYYAGKHGLGLLINGRRIIERSFDLTL